MADGREVRPGRMQGAGPRGQVLPIHDPRRGLQETLPPLQRRAFDAFVPLGAVKGETAESINKIVDDKDMLRLALPFGTLRYQSYVQLGFLYKKLGLKKSAKVILEEAKNLEEVAPLHSVRVDGANVQNEAVAKIDKLLAGL